MEGLRQFKENNDIIENRSHDFLTRTRLRFSAEQQTSTHSEIMTTLSRIKQREMSCLLKTFRDLRMFVALMHLAQGLIIVSVVSLVPALSTAVSITQQLSILFSKTLIRNKASR
jgi:hypothetical protein